MFVTDTVGVINGMSNSMTAEAGKVNRSHGVQVYSSMLTRSRAWGNLDVQHGASFGVHHYHRALNGVGVRLGIIIIMLQLRHPGTFPIAILLY